MTNRLKPRRLKDAEKFKLADLLRSRAEQIKADGPSFTELARELEPVLGVPLAPESVADVSRYIGLTWDPKVKTGGGQRSLWGAVKELQDAQAALTRRIVAAEDNVSGQRTELNVTDANLRQEANNTAAEFAVLRGLVHTLYYQLAPLGITPPHGYVLPPMERPGPTPLHVNGNPAKAGR